MKSKTPDDEYQPSSKLPVSFRGLPNRLTLGRVFAVPVILLIYPLDITATDILCSLIFAAAAITDFFDGYIARRTNSVTRVGQLLDPIADKILTAIGLLLIAATHHIPVFLAGLLLMRDIAISGVRLIALENGRQIVVSNLGKWKTVVQDLGIFCLMLNRNWFEIPLRSIGMISIWVALLLSYYSGYLYVKSYLDDLAENQSLS